MSLDQNSGDSIDVESFDYGEDVPLSQERVTNNSNSDVFDNLPKPPKMNFDSIGEFCFESDILALKGNNDYKNVLEAIVILEAQREQAVKDLDTLQKLKKDALARPLEFVERLKQNENLDLPSAQIIHPVPSIDWGKYALSGDPAAFKRRQLSRIAADVRKNFKRKMKQSVEKDFETGIKSAECLDNRTASQVNTNAQKGFSRHAGSNSLLEDNSSGNNLSRKRRKSVQFKEDQQQAINEEGCYSDSLSADEDSLDSKLDISDDEISPDLQETSEYQELLMYKRLLKKRIKSSTMTQHFGYKCKGCMAEPIVGVRYHCVECDPPIDICKDCVKSCQEIDDHSSDHQLEEIHHSNTGFLDRDYMHFLGNDYNYLDPNYMPAA